MSIETGKIYRHFKGNEYKVIAVATHTETGDDMVIYQDMYGEHKIYARPRDMFESPVDKEKYPDATQEMRFELLTEDEAQESGLNPLVEEFLDSDSASDRIEILRRLADSVTEDDINIMAGVMDIELDRDADIASKYKTLMSNLSMRDKFEANRLR